jgi:hypothetical protein
MFRSRAWNRRLGIAVCSVLLVSLWGASSALAQSPWWHLTAEPLPSNINPAAGHDEVVEFKEEATGGDVLWLLPFVELSKAKFAEFPYNATHEEAQAALEGLYGAGNVEVSGGPLGAGQPVVTELESYFVKFTGHLAKRPVELPLHFFGDAGFAGFPGKKLEGSASDVQSTKGTPSGEVIVMASDLGDAFANGEAEPITVSDVVPSGFEAVAVEGTAFEGTPQEAALGCSLVGESDVSAPACSYSGQVPPYTTLTMRLGIDVSGAKSGEEDVATVAGGDTRPLSVSRPISIGATTPFGIADYELVNENEHGGTDTQAGSHPFQQTTTVIMNQVVNETGFAEPAGLVKDLHFAWPAGLVGDPVPVPQCALAQFLDEGHCPADSAVGVAKPLLSLNQGSGAAVKAFDISLFNLVPSPGEPARLAFLAGGVPVYIDPSVRSGRDYGLTINSDNISQLAGFRAVEVTVWGVPGASTHDQERGPTCLEAERKAETCLTPTINEHPQAFLSLPTACSGQQLVSTVTGDAWTHREPTESQPQLAESVLPAVDGCDALPFSPTIAVTPDGQQASRPTGLNVDVHVPQQETLNPEGLSESDVRNITVTLPEGVAVNPAGADGLLACSEALVGYEGFRELPGEPGVNSASFAPRLPGSIAALNAGEDASLEPGVNFCPNASKIGEATIRTPLLPEAQPLKGAVYLAAQDANPFGSLIAMYVVVEDPVSGTLVRVAGQVHLSEKGQLETTFENSPQAPFEDAELHFFGGERAPLTSPAHCATYTTTASLTPWSGGSPVPASSNFSITSGPNGSSCPGAGLPFSPTMTAGTTNVQAGGFTPLVTTFSRPDGQQDLHSVQLHLPPGMEGIVASVVPCSEAEADAGTCPSSSLIGHTIVSVGVGGDPYTVTGGEVFLTEGYEGAPYGLSIVNPAVAGPFNLGKVVVRAKVEVDPLTAQLTATTNASGPYAIPSVLDGIPLEIQHINVTIDREHFIFNPTDCDPLQVTGTLGSSEGANVALSEPFQVTDCAVLGFKPKLSVATSSTVTKEDGTSFSLKLAYPSEALGKEAWFKEAVFDFPKQLPARLSTIQQACLEATFNHSPESCPSASQIGTMTVATPVLPGLLHGIVYFVSYGAAKFPEAVIVLKGEGTAAGVTVDLHAETFISKKGVTSATLHSIPGVPFSSVQLTLPAGSFSEFTNNGTHPCQEHLTMKTSFTAQNGLQLNQSTPVDVTGCAKAQHVKKKKRKKK